jgi:uncharacterized protein YndB with AHSA1/START domain
VSKPSLTIKRHLEAPPARVYAAWTNPAQIMRWWGPEGATNLSADTDVRAGGRFHMVFNTPDGEEQDVSGVYREVEPGAKLVFTWMWRTLPERQSLVTVLLRADGDGTLLTLIHEQFFDEAARDRHNTGWTGALDKLDLYLSSAERPAQ